VRSLRNHYHLLIPAVLILIYAAPLFTALLPSLGDDLTESYEPMKTLTFVYTHGKAFHKWGPLPNFLYAPVYAVFLGYWYLTGTFQKPTDSALSAFSDPFLQIGTLIQAGRLAGFAVCWIAVWVFSRSLARTVQSQRAVCLALVLCAATSPDLIFSFVATKPDGLMMAFLALALAVYGRILTEGFGRRLGVLLSLAAVGSLSCKEQTAPAFVAMYGWILFDGIGKRGRYWADYATMLMTGIGVYALVNVVYAPSSWWEHIQYWMSGPGKDPGVWSRPGYSWADYLRDTGNALLFNWGPGGTLAVLGSAVLSLRFRSRLFFAAWVPLLGYVGLMLVSAGYVQRYFLLPASVLSVLPVAMAFARAGTERPWSAPMRSAAVMVGAVALAANLWGANLAWAQVLQGAPWITERYVASHFSKQQVISFAYPWTMPPNSTRLSFLGYRVDERPLGELMKHPPDLPEIVLITREWDDWLKDFKNRPARNAMYLSTGYSYTPYQGMEPLGYRLKEIVHPAMPLFLDGWGWPPYRVAPMHDVLVYQKTQP
jgi:hypothetical protein